MFLALDVGNTNITIGLFGMKNAKILPNPLRVWRMSATKRHTSDEYAVTLMNMFLYSGFDANEISGVAVVSVIPSLNFIFEELIKKFFRKDAFFINHENSGDLIFAVVNSKKIGADRIANAVGASSVYGGECIIVDFGTTTTFDCLDSKGEYVGGAIVPGLTISLEVLRLRTAQLPQVEIKKPLRSIGTDTVECIQSGIYFGYIGLVKEILARMRKEMEVKHVIATGGLSEFISGEIKEIDTVLPNLTLEGMCVIWNKNHK
jgi:type III pantothenate kinase